MNPEPGNKIRNEKISHLGMICATPVVFALGRKVKGFLFLRRLTQRLGFPIFCNECHWIKSDTKSRIISVKGKDQP